jgi:glycosyltransferase involved in cell wall biosynthesis
LTSDARLYVDIQTIQSLRFGDRGIPRLATELSRALLAAHAPVAALALNPLVPWPARLHPELARAPQLTWNTAPAFRRARRHGPLVSFVISPFEGARPVHATLAAHVTGVPEVVMVHDLIPDVFGYDPQSDWGRLYRRRCEWVRRADVIVTPSAHTRRDLIERWEVEPARVVVIGEAASPFFSPPGPGEAPVDGLRRALPAITRPFVLSVSGPDRHKNTEALIDAWADLPSSVRRAYQLVVTCTLPAGTRDAWTAHAEGRGIGRDELVLTDFVDDEVLRALYRQASLFVMPSRYEGFGLPVLEAISCGCRAITSSASSLPEVLDWQEATFDPSDPGEIGSLIERALSDSQYGAELDAECGRAGERHTWPGVVERLLTACARLPESPQARPRRPRVALVGRFKPSPSWDASYNAEVAGHLARQCDLDCFTEPFDARAVYQDDARTYRMFPAAALGSRLTPAAYDLVLYSVGGEQDEAYRLAQTYPGVIWLHDLGLAERGLVGRARGVIVESELARDLLERELGPACDDTPMWVVPLAVSDDTTSFDAIAQRLLDLAGLNLEPSRPEQAPPPVSQPVP